MTGKISLSAIDLIAFDFDGVLTDNRVLVTEDGREAVMCNRADGLAFDHLRKVGCRTLIVSTEVNKVVSARGAKLRVPVLQAVQNKAVKLAEYCEQNGIARERTMFVGNDVNDLPAMRWAGTAVAVADAHPSAKLAAAVVLRTPGGGGVARELLEEVLGFDMAASYSEFIYEVSDNELR